MWYDARQRLAPPSAAGHKSMRIKRIKFTSQYNEFGERENLKKKEKKKKKVSRMNDKKIRFSGIIRHA